MASLKPEETFHNYLRLHFAKVSQSRARRLARQRLAVHVTQWVDGR